MGPAWNDTVVVVATEFGRTARVNGTSGTDHGTASTLILAGGALEGLGGIVGDWPTLRRRQACSRTATSPRPWTSARCSKACWSTTWASTAASSTAAVFPDSATAQPVQGLVRA